MQRWASLIGAVMLVLMAWAGGMAHAAERFDRVPVSAAAPAHYDGDEDQVPSDGDQGVTHHHSGCSGHHVAAPDSVAQITHGRSKALLPVSGREAGVAGKGPETQLRPPIA